MARLKQKKNKSKQASERRHEHETEAGVAGALAGAAMGGLAGPPGALVGAAIGGAVGTVAAVTLEKRSAKEAVQNDNLDTEIEDVLGARPNAPNVTHPPATTAVYSSRPLEASPPAGGEDPGRAPSLPLKRSANERMIR